MVTPFNTPDEILTWEYAKMTDPQIISRLDNLQDDIKEISQALVTLARIEERQSSTNDSINRLYARLETCDGRIKTLEQNRPNHIGMNAMWIAMCAMGAIIGYLFKLAI